MFAELSGKEIVSALSLADRVRGLSKKVSPNIWDPEEAAHKLRGQIKSQRSKLMSDSALEESAVRQLAEAVKELQVMAISKLTDSIQETIVSAQLLMT